MGFCQLSNSNPNHTTQTLKNLWRAEWSEAPTSIIVRPKAVCIFIHMAPSLFTMTLGDCIRQVL